MRQKLIYQSSNEVRLSGVHDVRTNQLLSGATASAQVKELDGADVGSPVTLAEQEPGEYSGILPAATPLTLHQPYEMHVTLTFGGLTRVFVIEATVVEG